MKYTCRKCGGSDPCFIDFGDAPAPEYCPCDGERVVWREVAEPAALPKLTAEDSKPQLPDWLKLGAWAAVGDFIGKIDWIDQDKVLCRLVCGGTDLYPMVKELKPVTFRAWTFEEAPFNIKARHIRTGKLIAFTLCSRGNQFEPVYWHGYPNVFSLAGFFDECEQLSGLPCGVPQVEGADLEEMPCD